MSKTSTRLTRGDIVEIRFLDHCEDGEDAIAFIVWGRVRKVTRTSYVVESWAYADPSEDDGADCNRKVWSIVRRAVTSVTVLHPATR